jgi:hypothetical protein
LARSGHAQGLAIALGNLGPAEWAGGNVEHAIVFLEDALVFSKANTVPQTVAISLRNLGLIARSQGETAARLAILSRSFRPGDLRDAAGVALLQSTA